MSEAKVPTDSTGLVDPHALPFMLKVCEAAAALADDAIGKDPDIFQPRGIDLRFVVERSIYFTMVNSAALYGLFVASQQNAPLPAALPVEVDEFAPFLVKRWKLRGHWRRKFRRARLRWRGPGWSSQRTKFRTLGTAHIEAANLTGEAPVLFQVVQSKFIRFLLPIAQALGRPYAFVTLEAPQVYADLAAQGLPRIHVTLDAPSRELLQIHKFGEQEFLTTHLNTVLSAFAQIRPACIVVPEGNAPWNELFNRAGHAVGVPTLCIQQGWSPVVHTGFRNMSYDGMCVWGDGFSDILAPFNPAGKFISTGSHLLERRPPDSSQENGAIAFFLQVGGSPLITQAAADGLLELASWAAARFPEREIRVREHPGSPLTPEQARRLLNAANMRLMPARDALLEDVMRGSSIAVSIFSTTLLEAAASGVIPLIVNVTGLAHYSPDIARDGAGIEVGNFHDAQAALVRLAHDRDYANGLGAGLDAVAGRYFTASKNEALAAIVAEIRHLCSGARSPK